MSIFVLYIFYSFSKIHLQYFFCVINCFKDDHFSSHTQHTRTIRNILNSNRCISTLTTLAIQMGDPLPYIDVVRLAKKAIKR